MVRVGWPHHPTADAEVPQNASQEESDAEVRGTYTHPGAYQEQFQQAGSCAMFRAHVHVHL